jgi:serine/threonine protein phosphatase PrpC
MGGHVGGDEAASCLIRALSAIEHGASGYAWVADAEREVQRVNSDLFDRRSVLGGITGSTLVALLVHDGHYACLWAGDSRGYLLRDDRLAAVTHDHSLVQQLVDEGALPPASRHTHPSAHVITRAVGTHAGLALDRRFAPVHPGDVFLLCSDGLTACVSDDEIAEALASPYLDRAADWLLATSLGRDAPDNVSFVIISAAAG